MQPFEREPNRGQDAAGRAVREAQDPEQDVFGADQARAVQLCLLQRGIQHPVGHGRILVARELDHTVVGLQVLPDEFRDVIFPDVALRQHLIGEAFADAEQSEQDMFGPDHASAQLFRCASGLIQGPSCDLRKTVCHFTSSNNL